MSTFSERKWKKKMSDLSWLEKLSHLRFSRVVLLMEKWFSIFIVCWLVLVGVTTTNIWISAVALGLVYAIAHMHYHDLEDAAGLPVRHLVLRF